MRPCSGKEGHLANDPLRLRGVILRRNQISALVVHSLARLTSDSDYPFNGPVEMLPQPLDNARSPIGMDDAGLTRSREVAKGDS